MSSSYKKQISDELVRDNIVEFRTRDGIVVTARRITEHSEKIYYLNKKLGEEIKEFYDAKSRIEEIAEVADLDELLLAIEKHLGQHVQLVNHEAAQEIVRRHTEQSEHRILIDQARIAKRERCGGFDELWVIVHETLPTA